MNACTFALAGLSCFSLLALGCSKPDVSGTIAGEDVSFKDQIAAEQVGGAGPVAVLELSSISGVCAAVGAGRRQPSAQTLTLTLSQGGGAAVSPGVFPVGFKMPDSGPGALLLYTETDPTCLTLAEVHGLAGSITIDTAGSGTYSGSVEVDLDTEDHVSFSFSTAPCAALASPLPPSSCP